MAWAITLVIVGLMMLAAWWFAKSVIDAAIDVYEAWQKRRRSRSGGGE